MANFFPWHILSWTVTFGWGVLLILWLVGASSSKPTRKRLEWHFIFLRLVLPIVVLVSVSSYFGISFLGIQHLPVPHADNLAGAALAISGIVFACWARLSLGSNWSGNVTIKVGHTLVRRGPYRLVRHPIYTGLLAAGYGTALVHGYSRCLPGLVLIMLAIWIKLRMEEEFLVQEFGDEYVEYRQRVKSLIPFLL